VYLVRHGQAGTRDAYDSLSELGTRQARLLGDHFVSQGIRFASAYVGALMRQQLTAEQISAAYANAGVSFPSVTVDPGWDEFDLGRVYREIAPRLGADDCEFRREYEAMREQVRISGAAHAARIHRKWLPCDTKVVEAWFSGRYPYSGETWDQFRERIAACRFKMPDAKMLDARQENILVVTSATPLAIWTSHWRFPMSGSCGSAGQCISHPTQSCVCEKSSYGCLPSMRCRTSPPWGCAPTAKRIPRTALERTATLYIVANYPLSYAARLVATLDFHPRIKDCFQRIRHVF
jgi:broad specificity phosphatase PhoE